MENLKKKNILITGASGGIGKSIKAVLEEKGFNCISPTRSELDLSSLDSIESYFSLLNEEIDGLVNNAAINIIGDIQEINNNDVEKMIKINLTSPLKIIQHVVKNMRKNGTYGKIVNVSSIWGIRSKEYRTLYSMTKFGINGMTKSLARELGRERILINSIAPGYVDTKMTDQNIPKKIQNKIKKDIPLGRFANPVEIAQLVAFLLSDENTYITGQTIIIDGGYLS
jgi:3-oxoacyl-[acyl-carrier protein] reductase